MNQEKINVKQGAALILLYLYGSAIIFSLGAPAGKDAWLAVILAVLGEFLLIYIYANIFNILPGKNILMIAERLNGKFFGKLFVLLYTIFAFYLGALVLRDFGEFLITVNFPETPMIFPMLFMSIVAIFVVKLGIEVLGRAAELTGLLVLILTVEAVLLPTEQMSFEKLMPVMSQGLQPVLQGAWESFSFPFAELVVFWLIMDVLREPTKLKLTYQVGLLLGGGVIISAVLGELMLLGENNYLISYFPSYKALGLTPIGFLKNIEVIAAVLFFTAAFYKISLCLLGACRGVAMLFKLSDYRSFVTPVGLLMLILGLVDFASIMELFENLAYWKYLALPFEVLIPIWFLVVAWVKRKQLRVLRGE